MTGIDLVSGRIIAITGAGGKTSLLFALQKQFCRQGKRVIVTTTTHMLDEKDRPALILMHKDRADGIDCCLGISRICCGSWQEMLELVPQMLDRYGYVIAAEKDPGRPKIRGIQDISEWGGDVGGDVGADWIGTLAGLCDILLVEADGSRRLPVKAPGPEEPVIPEAADTVIGVIGLSSLHKPISETAFRPELLADLLDKKPSDLLEPEDLVPLITSENGLRKNVGGRRYEVILNQADVLEPSGFNFVPCERGDSQKVQEIAEELSGSGIPVRVLSLKPAKKVKIILLAAGNSVRYGSNKLMEKMSDGRTMYETALEMLERTLDVFSSAEFQDRYRTELSVTVVTQERYQKVAEAAAAKGFEVRYNPAPERGISSSLKIGLEECLDAEGVLFTVCDQPSLSYGTIIKIITRFLDTGCGIICASNGGTAGNPCLFSSDFYEELIDLSGDKGGKQVVKKHPEEVLLVETDPEELIDIDESWGRFSLTHQRRVSANRPRDSIRTGV